VFRLKVRQEWSIGGKIIPATERFPKDEDFGKWAWNFYTLERAMKKYEELEGD